MKRLATLVAGSLVALAFAAGARAEAEPVDPNDSLPDVTVRSVSLEASAATRTAGSVIRGTATVSNPTRYPAVATFDNGLVGNFDGDGLPATVYAVEYGTEELALAPNETAQVPFSIQIPKGLDADGVAVKVRARLVGSLYRGWGYSERFSVEGDGAFALVSSVYFTLADGQTLSAAAGPTLYPDAPQDSVPLTLVLESQGAAVSLAPVVTVNARAEAGGEASTRRLAAVAVPANGSATATVPFTHGGQAPGVYEGEVSLVDAAGGERAPRIGFRYIVSGQAATVHAVSSSASSVEKGTEFTISLKLSGTPVDLNVASGTARASQEASRVEVRVVDGAGETVAEGSYVGVLPNLGEATFSLEAERAATSMVAQVSVFGADGREIFRRDFPVSEGQVTADEPPVRPSLAFPLAALAAALALLLAMVAWRRGSPKSALVAVLVGVAAWGFAFHIASASNVRIISTDSDGFCEPSIIYINSPQPQDAHTCSQALTVQGTVQYAYCTNSGGEGISQISVNRDGSTVYDPVEVAYASISSSGGHDHPYVEAAFSLTIGGGYLNRNGTYGILVQAESFNTACVSAATGVRSFTVSGCDQCLNVAGVQASVANGWVKDTCADEPGSCFFVDQPTACEVDNLRTVLPDPATWTATGCDNQCVWADGSGGTTETIVSSAVGSLTTTVKSMRSISVPAKVGSAACTNTAYSLPITCEATVVVEDLCDNIEGVQNPVPGGMSLTAGVCACPTGTSYDSVDDRCEDDNGECATCDSSTGCPAGTKYCDGVCVDDDEACDPVPVVACPLVAASQACVELFDRNGLPTGQLTGYSLEDLEAIFGYALPDAVRDQARARTAGQTTYPIWGVAGRVVSGAGSLDANYASSGCGGSLCSYSDLGCLTTTDPRTGGPVANCSPVNDIQGPNGVGPQALLEVEPSLIGKGGSCTVYWSSHEMRSCQVTGAEVSSTALAGTAKTPALQDSATYTLLCTGLDSRTYSDSDTCAVDPDIVEF